MGKQLKTGFLVLISVILLAGAGLYIFRNSLLQTLLSHQLSKQGLPLQSITELDISFSAFRLNGLAAGNNQELRLDHILATWYLPDLLAGKPAAIEVSGLHVALDLSAARPPLSSVSLMTAPSAKAISIPRLPNFSLKDSTISLHLAENNAIIALSGGSTQDPMGVQAIHLSANISGTLAQSKSLLTATLDTQGNMQGKITVSDGMMALPETEISSFSGEAAFAFAALQLQHIQTELVLSGIKLPGKTNAKPASGQADKEPAALTSSDAAIDQITLTGDVRKLAQSWTGTLNVDIAGGRLVAKPLRIEQLAVSLPMQIASGRDNWQVTLRNPGKITAGQIKGTPAHFQNALKFSIPRANLELTKNPRGWAFAHDIAITPGDLELRFDHTGSAAIEAQIHPGKITLTGKFDASKNYQGQFGIRDAAFSLPQSQLQLKDISATVHLNDTESGTATDFTIGRLQHLASEPLFAALSITGGIRNKATAGEPAVYALNMTGGVPDLRYLKISGHHAPGSGNGMLKAEIVPLDFSPDGLQPKALFPALTQLEAVNGQVSASAQFKWSREGIRNSQAAFGLRNLSFVRESIKLTNLNAGLNFTDLLSPRTPPRQMITIQRIDAGFPLENLLVSYHIENADPPRIAIEQAQFSMLDGIISMAPAIIDPAAARSDTLIRISNIDLETFLNLIKIDGLTGSGHLDGQIPLTMQDNQVTIGNSHFAAKTPGILRFNSAKASQLLASSGKEMNLLLQAAQDFHYTELSMDLDKSVTHDLVAKLSLLGNNPKVQDGQEFRLNIKLETDIDKILQTINQGYSLSHEILRGSLRLH